MTRSTQHERDSMLIEAGLALASEVDLETVLDRIVRLAVEITDARYGALGVISRGRTIERFVTIGVSDEDRARIGDPPVGHGILGLLIDDARPIRLPDIGADPRSVGFPPNHPPMRSFLGCPVRARGRVFGNIYLTEKRTAPEFDYDDQAALEVLATQAGVAVENTRLYEELRGAQEELRRLEVLEERERIAKELHDGVIQSLFAVGMSLQATAALIEDPAVSERLQAGVEDIDRSIRDLRNYIFGLRPGILADRELHRALNDLTSEFAERSGVLAVVDIDEPVAAELAARATDVVQIVRELLSNVARHAGATTCRITLRRSPDGAELEVDDDGSGFEVAIHTPGMGLRNLRARVESAGGSLAVESVPGEGTLVRATLPR